MDTKNRCCCGCCSLKTSTITIGVLGIVCSTLSLIGCMVTLITNMGAVYPENPHMPSDELAVIIAVFLIMFTELIVCVLLVYGAVWEEPRFMLPWLNYSIVCVVLLVLGLVVLIIISLAYHQIVVACCTLTLTYFVIHIGEKVITVVMDYYLQLKDTDKPPLPADV